MSWNKRLGLGWRWREFFAALIVGLLVGASIVALDREFYFGWNYLLILVPGFLVAYIVRKPGVALTAQLVVSICVFLLIDHYVDTLITFGPVAGLGMELGFALLGWRNYKWYSLLLAGLIATVTSVIVVYPITDRFEYLNLGMNIGISAIVGIVVTLVVANILKRLGLLKGFAISRE